MEKILGYDKDKLYMVHLTNFFPKGHKILSNYDGNRMYSTDKEGEPIKTFLGAEEKDVVVPAHRHTVHFSINAVVENTGDGAGNWDGKRMAIVEPFAEHKEQFVSFGGDSYTWGSVELSDSAIIIISKESLELIPQEERENYNFVICEGDISQGVKNFFIQNDLPLRDFPENDAGHANSIEYQIEQNLEGRDRAINFVVNNTFDGKSDIEFTLEEFSRIMSVCQDLQNTINCDISSFTRLPTLIGISSSPQQFSVFEDKMRRNYKPSEVIEAIIASGFYISEDGKVKIKDDEENYNRYKIIKPITTSSREEQKQYSEFTDSLIGEASQLYYKYIDILLDKPKEELLDFEIQIIQQTVQAMEEKEYTGLSESEKTIIDTYILNSTTSDLSEKQIAISKQLRPKGLKIDDNNFIGIIYTPTGKINISIGGNYPEDFEKWKSRFQNVKRSSM